MNLTTAISWQLLLSELDSYLRLQAQAFNRKTKS